MPPGDALFADAPAEVDLAALAQVRKVEQPHVEVFDDGAALRQFARLIRDAAAQVGNLSGKRSQLVVGAVAVARLALVGVAQVALALR